MQKALTDRTVSGLNWSFLKQAFNVFLSLSVGVILARILPPKDFGLLGMAFIFASFFSFMATLGMTPAVIQRRFLSKFHVRVAMTLSIVIGFMLTIVLWLLAAPISIFFNEPTVMIIIRVISITFLLTGIAATPLGLLRREMKFRTLFFIDLISLSFGKLCFAIPMALFGYGVWSLVADTLVTNSISCALLLYSAKPPLKPLIRRKEAYDLLTFGGGASINGLLYYGSINIDRLFISRFLSATALGLYSRAYQIMAMPQTRFSFSLSAVLFPAYSEIQGDKSRLASAYFRAINATSIIAFPVLSAILIAAEYIIVGIYGPNWSGATIVLRVLCIAGMLKAVLHLAGSVAYATGRIYSEVWRQSVNLILLIIGCVLAVSYGIEGIAFAVVLSAIWLYFSMAQLVIHTLESQWKLFFMAQLPGIVVAAIVAIFDISIRLFLESFFLEMAILQKLAILVASSILVFAFCFIYLPDTFRGPMPAWIADRYRKYFPSSIQVWIINRFNLKQASDFI